MTSEFDPDKWWTWPIPEHAVLTRRPNGDPWRLDSYGDGWCDGFEAGRKSLADEIWERTRYRFDA